MREFLHHLIFPRESNNHRAKALHHLSLLVLILVLIFGNSFIGMMEEKHSAILGITANFNQDDLLLQTNAKRAEQGLPPLQLNPQLSQAAYEKAQDMMAKNYWAHNAPDGTTPWFFIKNSGYEYMYAGENLARGFSTAPDVVNAWMGSPGHRENILSTNYDDVGFAVITGNLTGDETILVVQEFGRKMTGSPTQSSTFAVNTKTEPTPTPTLIPQATPTSVIVAQLSPTPFPTIIPSPTPPLSVVSPSITIPEFMVASIQSSPLIDSDAFSKHFTVFLVVFLIGVLVVDIIIIERKQIIRVVSHNIDHLMFFLVILLIIMSIGKGAII